MKPDEPRDQGEASEDDEDDDRPLRAMRSVWLEMRDEEPSSGGLDALMAAAHAKAATLRVTAVGSQPPDTRLAMAAGSRAKMPATPAEPAPGLSRRLASLVRRPAVLAFASLVVVASVALIASQQSSAPVSSPAVAPTGEPAPSVPQAVPAPAAGKRADDQVRSAARPQPEQPVDKLAPAPALGAAPHDAAAPAHGPPVEPAMIPRSMRFQQCESFAQLGDCVSVRRCAAKLQRDPEYRARIKQNAAIVKCLTE